MEVNNAASFLIVGLTDNIGKDMWSAISNNNEPSKTTCLDNYNEHKATVFGVRRVKRGRVRSK